MQAANNLTKAVILARGLGNRMRRADASALVTLEQSAAAESGAKGMMPIGPRPFLDYVLSGLADAAFSDVCLVLGPEHSAIRDYYEGEHKPSRIRVHFAIQKKPRGTADAVLAAEDFTGENEFAVMNSDNYYPAEALRGLQELAQPGTVLFDEHSLVRNSNIPEERIKSFAYGLVDGDGYLTELVEKPDEAILAWMRGPGLVSMNLWRFPPAIFDACRNVPLSARGELELTSAVMMAIHCGMRLRVERCEAGVLDLSQRTDIPEVVKRLANVQVSP